MCGDADDHEFRWRHQRDSDERDKPSRIHILLCHRRSIAADEKCFLRGRTDERAIFPKRPEKHLGREPHVDPEYRTIRLEYDPPRAVSDRFLNERKQSSNVYVM